MVKIKASFLPYKGWILTLLKGFKDKKLPMSFLLQNNMEKAKKALARESKRFQVKKQSLDKLIGLVKGLSELEQNAAINFELEFLFWTRREREEDSWPES